MNEGAANFARRVLARQGLVGLACVAALTMLGPSLMALEWDVGLSVLVMGLELAACAAAGGATLSLLRLRTHRFALRSLALGSNAVEALDIEALAALPFALTVRFFLVAVATSALVFLPGVRPYQLDDDRAISLFALAITIVGSATIPHYVLLRRLTLSVFELSPEEPVVQLLESLDQRQVPRRKTHLRLLSAVVLPVALVGVGAVLVVHAHLRTFVEESSKTTAVLVARAGFEASGPAARRPDPDGSVVRALSEQGFTARVEPHEPRRDLFFTREAEGAITASVPLEEGQAYVGFPVDLDATATGGGAAFALVAVLVAALLGSLLGRSLAEDLTLVTDRIRALGTENVLRGIAEVGRPARFGVVERLLRAIEALTERFRVFAEAQERALEAREAAQRMKGLLFASVSHDLKTPLNAILGFAELLSREELTAAQRESLAMIVTRGRELLALIETILDAARVEAGQLTLMPKQRDVSGLITEAVAKARDLAGDLTSEIVVEIPKAVPPIPADAAYLTRALAVVVAHALRTATNDPGSGVPHVRASLPASPSRHVRVEVEHGSRSVSPTELDALFNRQASSRGRGLTLGLSLARAVIELHGGRVEVDGSAGSAPVVRCFLPLDPPRPGLKRRRLPSYVPAI